MRRTFVSAVAVLMCTGAVMAADAGSGKSEFSVFATNLSYSESSSSGSNLGGGLGVALSRAWSPNWSTELSLTAERNRGFYSRFVEVPGVGLVPTSERRRYTVFPVDLMTQYRFVNSSRWTPYVAGGVRYVRAPGGPAVNPQPGVGGTFAQIVDGYGYQNRTSAQLGIGTALRLAPSVSLRFDLSHLLRSDAVPYDPIVRASVGLSWRF